MSAARCRLGGCLSGSLTFALGLRIRMPKSGTLSVLLVITWAFIACFAVLPRNVDMRSVAE
jgi:hypothetical protein